MAGSCLVVDEWLLEDLGGANGPEKQLESYNFLLKLKEQCDRIAVPHDSVWIRKAYGLLALQYSPPIRVCSQYLQGVILHDPNKCALLEAQDIVSIPEDIRTALPEEDLYLAEAYYSASATVLVTTDLKHFQKLATVMTIRARDDFLRDYLA